MSTFTNLKDSLYQVDEYSQKVHEKIKAHLQSADLDYLDLTKWQNDNFILEEALRDPGGTILNISKGPDDSMDRHMLQFARAVLKESMTSPHRFPMAKMDCMRKDVEKVLRIVVSRFGLFGYSPLRRKHDGSFYCGMLFVVNTLTGERIKLIKHPPSQLEGPHGFYMVPWTIIPYRNDWVPRNLPCRSPPNNDEIFTALLKDMERLCEETKLQVGVTERDFGYADIRVRVPVIYLSIWKDEERSTLLSKYTSDGLLVHMYGAPKPILKTDNFMKPREMIASPPFVEPIPENDSDILEYAERLLFHEYQEPPFSPKNEEADSRKIASYKTRYLHELKSKQAHDDVDSDQRLCHGVSFGALGTFDRCSFGLHLEPAITASTTGDRNKSFLTAGTFAPYPSWMSTPSRLDTASRVAAVYGSPRTPWTTYTGAGNSSWATVHVRGVLEAEERLTARVVASSKREVLEEGGEHVVESTAGLSRELDNDHVPWARNYSLCASLLDEEPVNGFSADRQLIAPYRIEELHRRYRKELDHIQKAEFRKIISSVGMTEDPVRDGTEFVFKSGCATGLTCGRVNRRELYEFTHSSKEVQKCRYDLLLVVESELATSADIGDEGSAVFQVIEKEGETRMAWCGMLTKVWQLGHQEVGLQY
ncbi:hypothetical protein BJ508DRAFT_334791 [Ascobolus immersus RN42]|uniref:Uncharacterized protein n=1 Tax=Ascobolus immersus RN42 TaxID=1160509 RepID=A0A3N4HJD7_ASCIM|nr:hypothetical protein BJ508DRAFT_334791 [Ascobolus immersus RN42]